MQNDYKNELFMTVNNELRKDQKDIQINIHS